MIHLNQISKTYEHRHQAVDALIDINLQIPAKKIFGIIGRSGAGKSTLVSLMNLLERPTTGEVSIDGICLNTLSASALRETRRQIGMVFQHFNLLNSRTVFENIALPLEISHYSKAAILDKVEPLLKLVNLSDRAQHYPEQLSGGQKQRVAIARALACDPKVLLCDEATSALDPESTQHILTLLAKINETYDLTIVMITHEMSVVKRLCDEVAILDQGRLVELGSTLDIFTRAQHPITKSLTKAALNARLPDRFLARLQSHFNGNSHPVIQLTFIDKQIEEPLLTHLHEKFSVETNVIQAHIDWIKETPVGITTFELLGEPHACEAAIQYLKNQPIQFEIIGYVNSIL